MQSEQVLDRLLLVTDTLATDMSQFLASQGLTTTKAHVLWFLRASGPSMQRQLSTDLGYSPRHVTTLVDDLVALGLVERTDHPQDRRAVLVALTSTGQALVADLEQGRRNLAALLFDHLDAASRAQLGAALDDTSRRLNAALAAQTP